MLGYVIEVMKYWLGRGAGGWRLDAAYAVPPAFWAKALPAVRESFPSAWFLGEMIHGDYAAYAAESGLDSITQYEVWKAIWSSLNDRNFFELDPRWVGTTPSSTASWRRPPSATATSPGWPASSTTTGISATRWRC